jgi:membrane protein required for colicin V production
MCIFAKKTMNTLDIIIIIPIAAGCITGLFKGFIKEVISIAIIFIGIYAARLLGTSIAELLISLLNISPKGAQPLAFIIIFSAVAILLTLLGSLIQGVVRMLSLGFINSISGAIIGGLKVALLISIVFTILHAFEHHFELIDSGLRQNSLLYNPVKSLAPELWKEITQHPTTNVIARL